MHESEEKKKGFNATTYLRPSFAGVDVGGRLGLCDFHGVFGRTVRH